MLDRAGPTKYSGINILQNDVEIIIFLVAFTEFEKWSHGINRIGLIS